MLALAPSLRAQYQITTLGSTITENFDTYTTATGTAVPTFTNSLNVNTATNATQRGSAWSFFNASNALVVTTSTNFQVNDTGSCTTGSFRSYGSTGVADRALGFLGSGNFGTFNQTANTGNYGGAVARFDNATGGTITSLVVTFTGEQWREAASAASFITFGFSVSSASGAVTNAISSPTAGLTFNSILTGAAVTLNGDNSANRNTTFTATISGFNIASGGSINLAFVYAGGIGGGSRQGLAIDDLTITASGNAAAASLLWSGASGDTWDTSTAKFASNATTWNNTTNAATTAEFGTASQNITVSTVTAGALKFSADQVALSSGTLTDGNASGGLSVEVTGSNTATLSTSVSTSNGLTKIGSGTLVLGGTQSALAGTVTVSSGTLQSDTTTVGTKNITNNGTLVFAQGADGTYSGTLANGGTVTKSGAGNLTIGTAVTGSGATNITGGTLTAGVDGAIATGTLTMASGTTFDLGTHTASSSGLTLTGSTIANVGTLTLGTGGITTNADAAASTISSGTLALGTSARSFTIADGAAASDLTISSNLTGSSTLTKAGAGTLTLTGTNSGTDPVTSLPTGFTGGFTMTGGTAVAANSTALGSGTITFANGTLQGNGTALTFTNSVQIGTGSTATSSTIAGSTDITFNGNWQQAGATANTLTISNSGATTLNGSQLDLTAATTNRTLSIAGAGNLTINSVIKNSNATGLGSLSQTGTGTLTLAGVNTYGGTTTVSNGKLLLSGSGTLGATTAGLTVNGGLLDLNGTTQTVANFTGTGGTVANNATGTAVVFTIGSGNGTGGNFAGVIADHTTGTGTLALTKTGTGTITLAAANTYTGGTAINGGTLALGATGALGTTGNITFGGGTLQYSSGNTVDHSARIANSGSAISIDTNGQTVTYAGILASTNTGGLTKKGLGTLELAGVNTYTGVTTVQNGTLRAGASDSLSDLTDLIIDAIAASTTAIFDLNGNNDTIRSVTFGGVNATSTSTSNLLTGVGTLTLGGDVTYDATNNPLGSTFSGLLALGASRSFNIGDSSNAATDLTVSAAISGSGFGLTKTGAGTLSLTGNSTYTGGATVSAGTLVAGSNNALGTGTATVSGGSLSVSSGITLNNNISLGSSGTLSGGGTAALAGTLNGTGTLAGTLTVNSGGVIAPGNSAGTLNNSSALTFNSGSIYSWELSARSTASAGTNYDQILNTGAITLNSGALIALSLGSFAPDSDPFWTTNQVWTIITSSGGGTITGTALTVSTAQPWSALGTFGTTINGNNLDLNWTTVGAVPEPSTYAAIFGAVALAGVVIKRRREKQKAARTLTTTISV